MSTFRKQSHLSAEFALYIVYYRSIVILRCQIYFFINCVAVCKALYELRQKKGKLTRFHKFFCLRSNFYTSFYALYLSVFLFILFPKYEYYINT